MQLSHTDRKWILIIVAIRQTWSHSFDILLGDIHLLSKLISALWLMISNIKLQISLMRGFTG